MIKPVRYSVQTRSQPDTDISLRDWFAGQALMGILSNSRNTGWAASVTAVDAYRMADAMLEARKRSSDVQDE